MSQEEHRR